MVAPVGGAQVTQQPQGRGRSVRRQVVGLEEFPCDPLERGPSSFVADLRGAGTADRAVVERAERERPQGDDRVARPHDLAGEADLRLDLQIQRAVVGTGLGHDQRVMGQRELTEETAVTRDVPREDALGGGVARGPASATFVKSTASPACSRWPAKFPATRGRTSHGGRRARVRSRFRAPPVPTKGTSAAGTRTPPSGSWWFSRIATSHRVVARVPLSVAAIWGLPLSSR